MDKTIEIVIVAMVILITATIVLFLVQDQTKRFDNFLDDQQSSAQCSLLKAQDRCSQFNIQDCDGSCGTPTSPSETQDSGPGDCGPNEEWNEDFNTCISS